MNFKLQIIKLKAYLLLKHYYFALCIFIDIHISWEIIKIERRRPGQLKFKVSPAPYIRTVSQEETQRSPLVKTMLWFNYFSLLDVGVYFLYS